MDQNPEYLQEGYIIVWEGAQRMVRRLPKGKSRTKYANMHMTY